SFGARAPVGGRYTAVAYSGRPVTLGAGGAWAQPRPAAAPTPSPSHFGGRFGGGFAGSPAASPPMRVYAPAGPRPYFAGAPTAAAPRAAPTFRAAPAGGFRTAAPTFRAAAPQGFSRTPSMPSGGFHPAASGGFHG